MDRNEQNLRVEALRAAVHQHDYEQAMEIADDLDLRKIRDNNLLSMIAEVYQFNHEYEKAKDALLTAYENTNSGRQLAYRLCLISIKTKEFDDAEEFYEDFVEMAPRDSGRYILKYKMAKAKNEPLEKQIEILEEYVNIDMEEKWAYELAKLYHLAGNREKCVDLCDEISLWFAEGKYVLKALELKRIYEPLSGAQQQRYVEGKQKRLEEASKKETSSKQQQATAKETPSKQQQTTAKETPSKQQPESAAEETAAGQEQQKVSEAPEHQELPEHEIQEEKLHTEQETQETHSEADADEVTELPELDDFEEIRIETGDGSKFDTVDIQAVVAEGMKTVEIEPENIHENEGTTKVAAGSIPFTKIHREETEISKTQEEVRQTDETDKNTADDGQQKSDEEFGEVHNLGDVQDILKQLQERGILKEETVQQAVTIIEEAGNEENKEIEEELAKIDAGLDEVEDEPEKESEGTQENAAEDSAGEIAEDKKDGEAKTDLSSTQNFSANVEVLSGADWTQEEQAEEKPEETEAEEMIPEEEFSFPDVAEEQPEEMSVDDAPEEVSAGETTEEMPVTDEAAGRPVADKAEETPVADEAAEKSVTDKTEEKSVTDKAEESPAEEKPEEIRIPEPGVTLSDEEMSVFKNYLNVEGLEEAIRETIEDLIDLYSPDGKSTDGNVIILGEEKTGKTTLAIELIKLVNKKRGRRNRKLAKVQASALNRRGFKNSLNKLIGCDLIVENAHELGIMTVSEIIDASGMFTDDMLMILEGDTQKMQDIITNTPRISEVFNHVIEIREYDIKEWVKYGKKYAEEQGYIMDELASLAFYKAIDDCFGLNKGIGQEDVERILDDAIYRNSRKLFKQKKNADGLIILMEKNFR